MSTKSNFYYPTTVFKEAASFVVVAPVVKALPLHPDEPVVILDEEVGEQDQGVYVYDGILWRFALSIQAWSAAVIRGDAMSFYVYPEIARTLDPTAEVYKNGIRQQGVNVVPGRAVYCALVPPAGGGSGSGVSSVNGQTGAVTVDASNLPGLASVALTNSYTSLDDKPAPYVLPAATASVLGGVKQGTGVTIAADGTLSVTGSSYTLPAATASVLGGVKVGANLSVTADGTLSAAAPYTLPVATASAIGGVKQGANITIAADGTISAQAGGSGYVLPAATSTVLGGIKVGQGLSVLGDGTLSADPTAVATTSSTGVVSVGSGLAVTVAGELSAVQNVASASVLGQVRVGSGLAIDAQGVLSVSNAGGLVNSVNGKQGSVLINPGSGIAIDNSGSAVLINLALTGTLVNAALGYTAYNGAANPSNFLTANQTITVTGDATGTGSTGIALTLANSGVTAGTYKSVTVDAKGRVTNGTNPTTLAGYGITDALSTATGGNVSGNLTFVSGAKVTGLPAPTVGSDASNKDYVDAQVAALANGVNWKQNVKAASTGPLALTAIQTVDGVSLAAGDRVLYKDATDQTLNGVYVVAAGAWTRATDVDTGVEIQGMAVLVLGGTVNALTQWVNTNATTPTIGTTNITYTQLNAAAAPYTAGTGLTLTGNQFSITPSGVTAGTFTKVTVNAQGQVTAGAQLVAADITTALTYTPVNKAGDTLTGALNWNTTATLASAATTSIGAASSNSVNVTGTTTITSLGTGTSGSLRLLTFAAVLTLTHNATSLILPTAANVTTQAGDAALFVSLGGSNWKCVSYTRADGTPLAGGSSSDPTKLSLTGGTMSGALNLAPQVSLASAATLNIGAANANAINVTGTTTITAFDTIAAGAVRTLVFAAALTLTNNAAINLPGGASITTAAGDVAEFLSLGGGNWKCVSYTRQSGAQLATTFTQTQRFQGSASAPAVALTNAVEVVNVVASAPVATQNIYLASGAVQYFTVAATANWVMNLAWSASQSLNSALAVGESATVAVVTTQGSTAYLPSSYTIDGTAVTPRWQGGTAPTAGNASGIDTYTLTAIKTAANTYTLLVAQTQYK